MAVNGVTFKWTGDKVMRDMQLGAERGLDKAGALFIRECKATIRSGGSQGKGKRRLSVSKPGQAPVSQTGDLLKSFVAKRTGLRIEITNISEHFKWLELGTQKMAPRPVMGPTYARTKNEMIREVGLAVRKSIS